MLASMVGWAQYISQESWRVIQLSEKHSKSLNNTGKKKKEKKKKREEEKTSRFSEGGFLRVEKFSPLVISRPP